MLRRGSAALAALVFALMLAGWPGVGAAQLPDGVDIDDRRADFEDLKKRIAALQAELLRTEADRSLSLTALAEAERAVTQATRQLARLEAERRAAAQQFAALEHEQRATAARIEARRAELASWVRRHYERGGVAGVAPLLAARDPNQLARDLHYLEQLGRARLALIDGLRADQRAAAQRSQEIEQRQHELAALEQVQREQRSALEQRHAERRQAVAAIEQALQARQQEVAGLQQDERRLAQVIEVLTQRARAAAAREAARREAAQRAAERQAAAASARTDEGAPTTARPPRRAEVVVGEATDSAGPTPAGVRFAQLRGQLRFPVRGELVGRFGAQRAEGGTSWKGVFVRADAGLEVRALARGEVVFADWLRGYGNLLIIDHGGDYLSVYGNNDVLLREVGDTVDGGEAVASVGSSGVGGESGLYFEIRHQGLPLDPLQWVRLD